MSAAALPSGLIALLCSLLHSQEPDPTSFLRCESLSNSGGIDAHPCINLLASHCLPSEVSILTLYGAGVMVYPRHSIRDPHTFL